MALDEPQRLDVGKLISLAMLPFLLVVKQCPQCADRKQSCAQFILPRGCSASDMPPSILVDAGNGLRAEFEVSSQLGVSEWRDPEGRLYDNVTCMFALHYFFASELALKQMMHNVSVNLKPGAAHM